MIESEEHLRERNEIAASIGQTIVINMLKKYRERFISQMKTMVPTSNDVYGINVHRALGRLDAIDFLIAEGQRATKRDDK